MAGIRRHPPRFGDALRGAVGRLVFLLPRVLVVLLPFMAVAVPVVVVHRPVPTAPVPYMRALECDGRVPLLLLWLVGPLLAWTPLRALVGHRETEGPPPPFGPYE